MPQDPTLIAAPIGATLARLRAALPPLARHGRLALGPAPLDAALGGGLALGALHAVAAEGLAAEACGAGTGFVACILGRLAGPVLWISPRADLFPAGLIRFGLDPARLLLAAPADDVASLAAMEAGLRAGVTTVGEIGGGEIGGGGIAAAGRLGATGRLGGRRLALACLDQGATGFLLLRRVWPRRKDGAGREDLSAAFTRWRIAPAPSRGQHGEPGEPCWHLRLLAARGGTEGEWLVEPGGEDDAAPALRLAAGLAADAAGPRIRAAG
jgi:protein ImuA